MSMKRNGFTLIELMIVVGVLGILITLAAPSMYDLILTQRLKGIHAQVGTDLQFARSEATSRNVKTFVRFAETAGALTCYIVYASPLKETGNEKVCACDRAPKCEDDGVEVRTVVVPAELKVRVAPANNTPEVFGFNPATGALVIPVSDTVVIPPPPYFVDTAADAARSLRTVVGAAGRPLNCSPAGSRISGAPCP